MFRALKGYFLLLTMALLLSATPSPASPFKLYIDWVRIEPLPQRKVRLFILFRLQGKKNQPISSVSPEQLEVKVQGDAYPVLPYEKPPLYIHLVLSLQEKGKISKRIKQLQSWLNEISLEHPKARISIWHLHAGQLTLLAPALSPEKAAQRLTPEHWSPSTASTAKGLLKSCPLEVLVSEEGFARHLFRAYQTSYRPVVVLLVPEKANCPSSQYADFFSSPQQPVALFIAGHSSLEKVKVPLGQFQNFRNLEQALKAWRIRWKHQQGVQVELPCKHKIDIELIYRPHTTEQPVASSYSVVLPPGFCESQPAPIMPLSPSAPDPSPVPAVFPTPFFMPTPTRPAPTRPPTPIPMPVRPTPVPSVLPTPVLQPTLPPSFSSGAGVQRLLWLGIGGGLLLLAGLGTWLVWFIYTKGRDGAPEPGGTISVQSHAVPQSEIRTRSPLPPTHIARLVVQQAREGYWLGRTFYIDTTRVTLGRHLDNDFPLPGEEVEPYHAEILFRENAFYLKSVAGSNVQLNGRPVQGLELLRHGDRIQLGYTFFLRFVQSTPSSGLSQAPALDDLEILLYSHGPFLIAAQTHPGRKGQGQPNEDAFGVWLPENRKDPRPPLVLVADGMGGHEGGALASRTVVQAFGQCYQENRAPSPWSEWLLDCTRQAHFQLHQVGQQYGLTDMGTTLVAAMLLPQQVVVVNVGDSRAYLLSPEGFGRISQDHSVVERLIQEGKLTPEEAHRHPQRSRLTQALSVRRTQVTPFIRATAWAPGTRLLLCSDGLWDVLVPSLLQAVLAMYTPADAVRRFIQLANAFGGPDNISVIVAEYRYSM